MARRQTARPLSGFTLSVFFTEAEHRCQDALIGAQLLQQAIREGNTYLIWFALRSILISAAAISQLAGGREGARAKERTSFRSALAIDRSCVLHNRSVRNHAEHIDERILRAEENGLLRNFVSYNVGPKNAFHFEPPQPFLLHFDDTLGIVSFWSDEVSIPEVLAEIRRILPLAAAASRQPVNVDGLVR